MKKAFPLPLTAGVVLLFRRNPFRIARIAWALLIAAFPVQSQVQQKTSPSGTARLKTEDIRIRDPFIYGDKNSKIYYLYAATDRLPDQGGRGVVVYTSKDLQEWEGPFTVFRTPADFWAQGSIWAPEMHAYQGKYYLFATFTGTDSLLGTKEERLPRRGTQIMAAASPKGPFLPFANKSHTPTDWLTLDGTLYVEGKQPWMVFCHEWLQMTDGTMELIRLKKDLSATEGQPVTLFKATEAPWVKGLKEATGSNRQGYVTDGPFLYKSQAGPLLMIWSSFGEQQYAIGVAVSASGKIAGPWKQQTTPLFKADGGHGMIFRTFTNQLMLVLHQPNHSPQERMRFFPLIEKNGTLIIEQP